MQLSYVRGGRYRYKFQYVNPDGTATYLDRAAAINWLVEAGSTEEDAAEALNEIKEAAKVPTRNYSFRCDSPKSEHDQDMGDYILVGWRNLNEYIFAAAKYRNAITEVERRFRQEKQRVLEETCPIYGRLCAEVVLLDEAIDDKRAVIKRERARKKSRVSIPGVEAEIKALKKQRTDLKRKKKAAKATEYDQHKDALGEAYKALAKVATDERNHLRRTQTTADYPLLCQIKDVLERAKTRTRGGLPRFNPLADDITLTTHKSGGLSLDRLGVTNLAKMGAYIYISPPANRDVYMRTDRKGRQHPYRDRPTVYFCLGSRGGKPVWVPLTLRYSADWDKKGVPLTARIKESSLLVRRVGSRREYSVMLTVTSDVGFASRISDGARGHVVTDFGWREVAPAPRIAFWKEGCPTETFGGIRVCAWKGSDGQWGELVLPDHLVGRFAQGESLQLIRDKIFNNTRDALVNWLGQSPSLPEWFAAWKGLDTLSQWRSPRRLSHLVYYWLRHRFDGDEAIMPQLIEWRSRKGDKSSGEEHLYNWMRHGTVKAKGIRKAIFLNFRAHLRARYRTVGIDNIDLKQLSRRANTEDSGEAQRVRWNMRVAACGQLKEILAESGMEVYWLDTVNSTKECHACGHTNDFGSEQFVTCVECKTNYDRDWNTVSLYDVRLWDMLVREKAGLAA